jgi:hypothetical protein
MARSRNRTRSRKSAKRTQKRTQKRSSRRRSRKSKKGGGAKRKLNSWQLLVKKTYRAGKSKNKHYNFGMALRDAKKSYKKH